jgi:hypothetical protein
LGGLYASGRAEARLRFSYGKQPRIAWETWTIRDVELEEEATDAIHRARIGLFSWLKPPVEMTTMTQLAALTLTKTQFDQIPADERLFYFMAGQLHNDINILTKLLAVSINEIEFVGGELPKRSAAAAQVLLLLKLTAGRLYEGYKMINETFSAKGFRKKYKVEMSSATLVSLDTLNKYFGSNSAIQRIRTKFAFHLDAKLIEAAYANAPSEFTSVEYLSKISGHNLFHTSETLSLIAIIGDARENWQDTLDQTVEEITATCFTVTTFLMGFIDC